MYEFLVWCRRCGSTLVQVLPLWLQQCIKIGSVYLMLKGYCMACPRALSWAILFSLYTSPLSKVIQNHPGMCFHFYADDTHLMFTHVHLMHKHATQAFDNLKNCLDYVKNLLFANKLKLNPDKTEFILFRSRTICTKFSMF